MSGANGRKVSRPPNTKGSVAPLCVKSGALTAGRLKISTVSRKHTETRAWNRMVGNESF